MRGSYPQAEGSGKASGFTPVASCDANKRLRPKRKRLKINGLIVKISYASRMRTHTGLWITFNLLIYIIFIWKAANGGVCP